MMRLKYISLKNNESFIRGHKVYYDKTIRDWRYKDTNEITLYSDRPCKKCGGNTTIRGYDNTPDECLGYLPNVKFACCGHGKNKMAYVIFNDNSKLYGIMAIKYFNTIKEKK
jgi:hypothetical protein